MSSLFHNYLAHDQGTEKDPSFFPIYERHFGKFVNQSPLVLEIGVNNGKSLGLLKEYFGGNSFIVGMDINPACEKHAKPNEGKYVHIGDATNPEDLARVLAVTGAPDIVIDDGSHVSSDIIKTFEYLYPRTARHGVYLVEDLHMCWENGYPVQNSFIEYAKGLMDETQSLFRKAEPRRWFSLGTVSMTAYQSVIVFEKGLPFHQQITHPDMYVTFKQPWGDDIKTMRRDSDEIPFPPEPAP